MTNRPIDVVVAGHICLDIIPQLSHQHTTAADLFVPGGLVHIGPATLALGGCVANTGQALHRLGAATRLVGKIGDDLLGTTILASLRQVAAEFPDSMVVAPGEATSYSIVLSPPQVDRGFLHCCGANDTFSAADLRDTAWQGARLLHFGYPPLMRAIAADGGRGLADKFAAVRAAGLLVSLDMAMPPRSSTESPTDWRRWLATVLPQVDVFLPSVDEVAQMLGAAPLDLRSETGGAQLAALGDELIALGAPIVVIKLGDQGLYLRTSDTPRLGTRAAWCDFDWPTWQDRELVAPCFKVPVVGTTGSGDCTIAGFLMALLQHCQPAAALRFATGVGAYCVQSADATSNIPPAAVVAEAVAAAWPQLPLAPWLQTWRPLDSAGVLAGPADQRRSQSPLVASRTSP